MSPLEKGAQAPAFHLTDAGNNQVSLADFAGRRLILYIFPAALTPGCTVEAMDFSAAAPDFQAAGYDVVGLSPDTPAKLTAFAKASRLTIRLLSDPDHQVIEAYGGWGERMLWGKRLVGVIRSTFVIEVDSLGRGTISDAQYGVRAIGHVARLRQLLKV